MLDLAVEIESLSREMSTRIKQYQVVVMGSPQRSRRLEIVSRIDFNAATSQDAGSDVTSTLLGIDDKNLLVIENRATKWWWLVHPALPRQAACRRRQYLAGFSSREGGKSRKMGKTEKARGPSRGLFCAISLLPLVAGVLLLFPLPILHLRLALFPFAGWGWKLRSSSGRPRASEVSPKVVVRDLWFYPEEIGKQAIEKILKPQLCCPSRGHSPTRWLRPCRWRPPPGTVARRLLT